MGNTGGLNLAIPVAAKALELELPGMYLVAVQAWTQSLDLASKGICISQS
jgi:hypothetical protein